jgi:hypothetical protein
MTLNLSLRVRFVFGLALMMSAASPAIAQTPPPFPASPISLPSTTDPKTGLMTEKELDPLTKIETDRTFDPQDPVTVTITQRDANGNQISTGTISTDAKSGIVTDTRTDLASGQTTTTTTDPKTGGTTTTKVDRNGELVSAETITIDPKTGLPTTTNIDFTSGQRTTATVDPKTGDQITTQLDRNGLEVSTETISTDRKTGIQTDTIVDPKTGITTTTRRDRNGARIDAVATHAGAPPANGAAPSPGPDAVSAKTGVPTYQSCQAKRATAGCAKVIADEEHAADALRHEAATPAGRQRVIETCQHEPAKAGCATALHDLTAKTDPNAHTGQKNCAPDTHHAGDTQCIPNAGARAATTNGSSDNSGNTNKQGTVAPARPACPTETSGRPPNCVAIKGASINTGDNGTKSKNAAGNNGAGLHEAGATNAPPEKQPKVQATCPPGKNRDGRCK